MASERRVLRPGILWEPSNLVHAIVSSDKALITFAGVDNPIVSMDATRIRDDLTSLLKVHPVPQLQSLLLHYPDRSVHCGHLIPAGYIFPPWRALNLGIIQAPLTYLELRGHPMWEFADEALEALSCLPGLVTLVLDGSVRDPETPSYGPHSVALPRLRRLELALGSLKEYVGSFLKRLAVPSDVSVELLHERVPGDGESDEDFAAMAADFHSHIPESLQQVLLFEHLLIHSLTDYLGQKHPGAGYTFEVFEPVLANRAATAFPESPPALPEKVTYDFLFREKQDDDGDLLARLLPVFVPGLRGVQVVCVQHEHAKAPGWWSRLGDFVNVERIHTTSSPAYEGLLTALDGEADDSPFLFPRLRVLRIEDAPVAGYMGAGALGYVVLARVLAARRRHGCPIDLVMFENCEITPSIVRALHQLPGMHKIVWDGDSGGVPNRPVVLEGITTYSET
ncbi:hypothetical protein BV25DRAFT_1325970 [Artomyces pyxidatus]|uniref:Uncharacterized protein n=1 Tax=Artomyces pyxidatus TaxID=48021 RepID=A0ACB8SQI8_9AGAM|nr:hypothetical protein BV25DRAFT_1325970 [Artomyces pyxidatus]